MDKMLMQGKLLKYYAPGDLVSPTCDLLSLNFFAPQGSMLTVIAAPEWTPDHGGAYCVLNDKGQIGFVFFEDVAEVVRKR